MKTKSLFTILTILFSSIAILPSAFADTHLRATSLTQKNWDDLEAGKTDTLIIEFKQGDRLPVSIVAQGDFLETSENNPSFLTVKRPFWIRFLKDQITISTDGSRYLSFKDVIKGQLSVGSTNGANGAANAINLILKADAK